jgi:hypothetical protein
MLPPKGDDLPEAGGVTPSSAERSRREGAVRILEIRNQGLQRAKESVDTFALTVETLQSGLSNFAFP